MPMTLTQLERTELVLNRFLEALNEARLVIATETHGDREKTLITGSKETGALRRASLDLTRALADLRRPQ